MSLLVISSLYSQLGSANSPDKCKVFKATIPTVALSIFENTYTESGIHRGKPYWVDERNRTAIWYGNERNPCWMMGRESSRRGNSDVGWARQKMNDDNTCDSCPTDPKKDSSKWKIRKYEWVNSKDFKGIPMNKDDTLIQTSGSTDPIQSEESTKSYSAGLPSTQEPSTSFDCSNQQTVKIPYYDYDIFSGIYTYKGTYRNQPYWVHENRFFSIWHGSENNCWFLGSESRRKAHLNVGWLQIQKLNDEAACPVCPNFNNQLANGNYLEINEFTYVDMEPKKNAPKQSTKNDKFEALLKGLKKKDGATVPKESEKNDKREEFDDLLQRLKKKDIQRIPRESAKNFRLKTFNSMLQNLTKKDKESVESDDK